jgi:hypothetical protein
MFVNQELYATGALQLIQIISENQLPLHYEVQFYSDAINLKEALKDKGLNELEWSDLDHLLDNTNALSFLGGNVVPTTNLRYPMASVNNFWVWEGFTGVEDIREIKSTKDGILNREIRPSIPVADVIQRIFDTAGFDFLVDFAGNDYYDELYMWIHNSKPFVQAQQIAEAGLGSLTVLTTTEQTYVFSQERINEVGIYSTLTGIATIGVGGISYTLTLDWTSQFTGADWQFTLNGVPQGFFPLSTGTNVQATGVLSVGDTITIQMRASFGSINAEPSTSFKISNTTTSAVDQFVVGRYMPTMKAMDFLKGILNVFNAVMYWDAETDKFIIQHRVDWFAAGKEVDITENVDVATTKLGTPTFYRTYGFRFKPGLDFRNTNYLDQNGRPYGSAFYDTGYFFGTTYTSRNPFTSCIWGEVITQAPNGSITVATDIASFQSINKSRKSVDPGVRLMYYNGQHNVDAGAGSYKVVDINGSSAGNKSTYNFFLNQLVADDMNLSYNPQFDFQASGGAIVPNNLYSVFYNDYIASIYNPNVRRIEVNALIPYNKLKTIQVNDTILFQGNSFFIEQMQIDLVNNKARFRLINKV